MITLYHCMSARSFRPLWTMEELGLPYALKMSGSLLFILSLTDVARPRVVEHKLLELGRQRPRRGAAVCGLCHEKTPR